MTESDCVLQQQDALQNISLPNGRQISFSECGDISGRPVLFFHPIQGNRYMPLTIHKYALALRLRIIAPDRPGIGDSSPAPGRTVEDYPSDVAHLCKQLGIQRFSIMASSAGTMYALACSIAAETRDMVIGPVTILAPWIPPSSRCDGGWNLLAFAASWTPLPVLQALVGFSNGRIVQQSLTRPVTDLMTRATEVEKAAFAADPQNDSIYKAMISEWNRSLVGIVQDMQLCTERSRPLSFNYCNDITAAVRVYMGTDDKMLAYNHVQQWAERCSHVDLITVKGGTHDGLMHTHKAAALESLAHDLDVSEQRGCVRQQQPQKVTEQEDNNIVQ